MFKKKPRPTPQYFQPPPPKKAPARRFPLFLFTASLFCLWLLYTSLIPVLPTIGEPPRFYSNQAQQELYQTLLAALRKAEKSIHLVMFGLSDPAVISTLSEKIGLGIPTTIYYDPSGSKNLATRLHGGKIQPVKTSGLMHHKILILDEETVFIGSANMTTPSLKMHDNLVLGFASRKAARFLKDHSPSSSGYLRTMIGGQDVEFWLLPDPRGHALTALRKKLRSASHSIRIALFTLTHPDLVDELIYAHKRGVAVTLVLDMHAGLGASAKTVERLRSTGVRLFFSQGSQLLHHKFAYIDQQLLIMGSANWTQSAFTRNSDCLVMLHSLDPEQKLYLKRLWRRIETEARLQSS